jgi:UDP-3-O-[3-hydroxymyristoyl] glucosamine N-acyltransferase
MSRSTFFERSAPISIGKLAEKTDSKIGPGVNAEHSILDVASVIGSGPGDVTSIHDKRYLSHASGLKADACFIDAEFADRLPANTVALITTQPELAFSKATALFYPESLAIGSDTIICANAVIGSGVKIGRNCTIGPSVSIVHTLIGDHVIIHPGACIGQDGFGYVHDGKTFIKIPQIGRVIIQSHVEIGANTTIDRGALNDTVVGEGTKIDNLVAIAHNVSIGRSCILAGQTGISGSSGLGDNVLLGGQVGINPHVFVSSGAQVAPQSGVNKNISEGDRVIGSPHRNFKTFSRELRTLRKLAQKGTQVPGGAE